MKRISHSAFLASSLFVITLLTFAVGYGLLQGSVEPKTEAVELVEAQQACGMDLQIAVDEEQPDGTIIPFDFSAHTDVDPQKWGITDTLNEPPYTAEPQVIHFNDPNYARYAMFIGDLSFVPFPKQSQIYPSEQNTHVRLHYQGDIFDIVRREVATCSLAGSTRWLCQPTQNNTTVAEVSNIPVQCGVELAFGWVVKRKTKRASAEGLTEFRDAAADNGADINGDGIVSVIDLSYVIGSYGTHDPQGDVNKDGIVNGLDYSLVVAEV